MGILIKTPEGIIDYDLDLLVDVVRLIDDQLEKITQKSMQSDDPDSFGYFDQAEHITGLGFVACQAYTASTYGFLRVSKSRAMSLGPRHSSGKPIVELINHAANYWKHNGEWPPEKTDHRKRMIEEAFDAIGFPVNTDYPLSGVLTELASPHPASFVILVPLLETWRNDVRVSDRGHR